VATGNGTSAGKGAVAGQVRIRILDGTTREVIAHVRSGAADLGVTEHTADHETDHELHAQPLRADPWWPSCHPTTRWPNERSSPGAP
jgi:DNA-binding transcriptional LysR family regulator